MTTKLLPTSKEFRGLFKCPFCGKYLKCKDYQVNCADTDMICITCPAAPNYSNGPVCQCDKKVLIESCIESINDLQEMTASYVEAEERCSTYLSQRYALRQQVKALEEELKYQENVSRRLNERLCGGNNVFTGTITGRISNVQPSNFSIK